MFNHHLSGMTTSTHLGADEELRPSLGISDGADAHLAPEGRAAAPVVEDAAAQGRPPPQRAAHRPDGLPVGGPALQQLAAAPADEIGAAPAREVDEAGAGVPEPSDVFNGLRLPVHNARSRLLRALE